jgi:capsular exopolysaccharide synthesis family protein
MEKQLEDLKAKMETSSTALAKFERELNLINPEEKTSILSARLLQLNTEHTNAQADRVRKEAAFESIRAGTLEAAQASAQGEQIRRLGERIDEAREKFASVKTQYGANHPEYKKSFSQLTELERQLQGLKRNIGQRVEVEFAEAKNREAMLRKAVADTKLEFDKLNARSYEYKNLKQEAEADKKLYEELVHKIKEAGINASFQNSSIRLADSARPGYKPVFPDVKVNALLAFLLASFLAVGAAVLSDVLDHTVRDPDQIQKGLRTEVIGSLPSVRSWHGRLPGVAQNASHGALVKSHQDGDSKSAAFEEAIRTLRDSILLSDLDHRPRSLLITSATPREGKTTTCVHLAVAHSLQNRKTLIIDCDLRRPSVHGRLGVPNEKGLANVINDGEEWRALLTQAPGAPYLDVLPAGPASRRTADRIGGVLELLLKDAVNEYDLVILDAPPLLGFAEPLQMATLVDGVVVVTLAGQTNRNAVATVLNNLKRLKANVIGVALNEVREEMSDRYYYGYHGKYYNKYYQPAKS